MSLAYGGLFSEEAQTITIPDDAAAIVELPEPMTANNVTLGANSIIITMDGDYKIDFSITLQSTSGTFGLLISVRVNGLPIAALTPGYIATSDMVSYSSNAIVSLEAGNILDLVLYSATGGNVLLGPAQNATLVVIRLGP